MVAESSSSILKISWSSVAICFWITCLTNVLSESLPPDASKNGNIATSVVSAISYLVFKIKHRKWDDLIIGLNDT